MAIDTMGSPEIKRIVTDSNNRVANARKKAEKSSVGIMVLSTADQALKAKAAKRAEEFWNSDNAELAQAEDYFNASTEFQIAHKAKYGDMTRSQWEQAKRIEHKKQWATDNISELDPLIAQELNAQANLDLENDLEIYNKRYNLSSDMKLSGSMTLPKLEKRYYESYNTNKEKEIKNRINKAGVLNSTLNFFGIGREDDAESIEMKAMQAWKDNATAEKVRWDETTEEYKVATGDNKLEQMYHTKKPNIDVTAVYGSFNKELGSLINNDGTKDYIKGNTSLQIKYGDGEDRETISAFEFSNQLNREDRIAFWKNVKVIASADYYKYKKSFGASSEGVLETTDFLQGAIDKIQQANNGTPRLQGIDSKRTALDTFGDWFTGRSASYDAMTPNELRAITIGELDSKYTSNFNRQQTQNYNNVLSSTALSNAADNIDLMSGQGVEVDTVYSIYNFLSAKNNDTNEYKNTFTRDEIENINEALDNSPDSNAKAQTRLLFNQRIAEMPEETSKELVTEIQETITATDESLGYANTLSTDELDKVIGKKPFPAMAMEDFKTVEDYFKDTDNVDFNVTEAFKNLYSTVKGLGTDFLDYAETKMPDPTRLEYSAADVKASEDALKETYNKVAPVVKQKTKQLIAEAPENFKDFMKEVETASNDFMKVVSKADKVITSGTLTTFAVVDATKYGTELLELAKETALKTQDKIVEIYDSTEEARKDIKDQAKLMTFYDEITKPNWQAFQRNVVDDYKTFALNNNISQEDFMKALESAWGPLFAKIQDQAKSLLAPEEKD